MSRVKTDRLAALMNEAVLVAGRGMTGGSGETSTFSPRRIPGFHRPSDATYENRTQSPESQPEWLNSTSLRPQIWARLVLAGARGICS